LRNLLLVARFEVHSALSKRSFWVTTFILPVLILGLTFGSQLLFDAPDTEFDLQAGEIPLKATRTGLVDPAGLVDPVQAKQLYSVLPDEAAARSALDDGEIEAFFILDTQSLQTGEVTLVMKEFAPFSQASQAALLEQLLQQHISSQAGLNNLLAQPLENVELISLSPGNAAGFSDPLEQSSFLIPYAVLFLFFMVISISSGMALRAVSKEKENRTAEILLVSVRPRDLLAGKLLGLSLVTLLQILMWFLVLQSGSQQAIPFLEAGTYLFPQSLLAWGIPFLLTGFLMYGSALLIIGVLAPSAREGTQLTFLVYLPLMVPLMLNSLFATAPESAPVLFLSMFPLTAPLSMVTRLAISPVPVEEAAASLAGVLLTALLLLHIASRLFRADTLLSSAALNPKRLAAELRSVFMNSGRH